MVWLVTGCAVGTGMTIEGHGSYAATPAGTSAVLRVQARPMGPVRSGEVTWGIINTPNAEARFAELLANAAREPGGLDVLHPVDAARQLQKAGMPTTLQPDDEQLQRNLAALGCSSCLVANVTSWRYSYVFFSSSSVVEYTLSCLVPGRNEPVWTVNVHRSARGMGDREVAMLALRETFQWLKDSAHLMSPPPPPQ